MEKKAKKGEGVTFTCYYCSPAGRVKTEPLQTEGKTWVLKDPKEALVGICHRCWNR